MRFGRPPALIRRAHIRIEGYLCWEVAMAKTEGFAMKLCPVGGARSQSGDDDLTGHYGRAGPFAPFRTFSDIAAGNVVMLESSPSDPTLAEISSVAETLETAI